MAKASRKGPVASSRAPRVWLTGPQLARLLGVTRQAVAKWVAAGCPSRTRNGRRDFDPEAVAAWLKVREEQVEGDDLTQARIRKLKAEVGLMELRAKVASGEWVPVQVAADAYTAGLLAVRQGLNALPAFAGLMVHRTEAELRAILVRELKRVREHGDLEFRRVFDDLSTAARREARDELAGRRRAVGV